MSEELDNIERRIEARLKAANVDEMEQQEWEEFIEQFVAEHADLFRRLAMR